MRPVFLRRCRDVESGSKNFNPTSAPRLTISSIIHPVKHFVVGGGLFFSSHLRVILNIIIIYIKTDELMGQVRKGVVRSKVDKVIGFK